MKEAIKTSAALLKAALKASPARIESAIYLMQGDIAEAALHVTMQENNKVKEIGKNIVSLRLIF